jgi:hypothetical protein
MESFFLAININADDIMFDEENLERIRSRYFNGNVTIIIRR